MTAQDAGKSGGGKPGGGKPGGGKSGGGKSGGSKAAGAKAGGKDDRRRTAGRGKEDAVRGDPAGDAGGAAGTAAGGGPDPADARALAERFLDLWQRQATAMMDDPVVARSMAQWLAQVPSMMAMATAAPGSPARQDRGGGQEAEHDARSEQAAGTGPGGPGIGQGGSAQMAGSAAPASGTEQPDPGELLRRLAACEERLDRLEGGLPKRRR